MQYLLTAYRWPLLRPIVTATTALAMREGFMLQLGWPGGPRGLGEAVCWPGFGSTPADFAAGETDLIARLAAHAASVPPPPSSARAERGAATAAARERRRLAALAWVDAALQQLVGAEDGRASGAPLPAEWLHALESALLGAAAMAADLPLAVLLASSPSDAVALHVLVASASEAQAAKARGATAFKVKIGRRALSDEIGHLAGLRAAIGPAAELRLDANGAWTPAVAHQAMLLLPMVSPAWLEQPLPPAMLAEARALRALGTVPLAADEGLTSQAAIAAHLAARAADVYVLKPPFVGGPRACVEAARTVLRAGHDVLVTHAMETGLGTSVALHVAAAIGSLPQAEALSGRVRAHGLTPVVSEDVARANLHVRAGGSASSLAELKVALGALAQAAARGAQGGRWRLPAGPGLGDALPSAGPA